MFHLAGVAPPQPGLIDLHVRPSVLRMVDRFVDLPTLVLSAKGDVLAWNAMSSALHGDWSALPPERRNQSRLRFLPDPAEPPRALVGGSEEQRAPRRCRPSPTCARAAGRYPDDPGLQRLLADLHAGSAEFRELWERPRPAPGAATPRRCVHPLAGVADAWSATPCTSPTPTSC